VHNIIVFMCAQIHNHIRPNSHNPLLLQTLHASKPATRPVLFSGPASIWGFTDHGRRTIRYCKAVHQLTNKFTCFHSAQHDNHKTKQS